MNATTALALEPEIDPSICLAPTTNPVEPSVNVLLVEDDPEAAQLVQERIREDGNERFRVEWSPNLLHAMYRLDQTGIDVVILDLGMPELNGYKSYRAIEFAAGNKVPIVIFTGDDSVISRELTLRFGAAAYLLKDGTTPAELRQALHNALLRWKPSGFQGPDC